MATDLGDTVPRCRSSGSPAHTVLRTENGIHLHAETLWSPPPTAGTPAGLASVSRSPSLWWPEPQRHRASEYGGQDSRDTNL